MKAIQALLFDAGGTLIRLDGRRICRAAGVAFVPAIFAEAEDAAVAGLREWISRHPRSTDPQRLPVFFAALLSALGAPQDSGGSEAATRVAAEHRRSNLWSLAARGAGATLAELKLRGYRLAVVSNADGRARALLGQAGLLDHLELVIDSAEAGVEKPDPAIFLQATDRLGVPPTRSAYVGDLYEFDVAGARSAGLTPILIGSCPSPEPVVRVPDLPALLELFPGPEA
jgi:HAD superfamily hydrolase (TIGR01509 family)